MIITDLDPKHGACSLIVESSEDLWTLRRLIAKGDTVVTRSSRVVKREDEFSRPDKGERVSVTVALIVEEVHLDSSIERVRVKGTISESSDETITKVGSHSVTLTAGHPVTIRKEKWSPLDTKLVRPSEEGQSYILVTADRREAGVGTLRGSHLSVVSALESGLGGKGSDEESSKPFMSKVVALVGQSYRKGDIVVVAGPGSLKNALANQIRSGVSPEVRILEGFDLTGSDGIRAMVRSPEFQKVASGSVMVELQKVVEEFVKRVAIGDPKVAYTLSKVAPLAHSGVVEACAISDDVFSTGVDEQSVVDTLNQVESKGGIVYLADSSLELGKQVSSFGGIVALLRYAVRS